MVMVMVLRLLVMSLAMEAVVAAGLAQLLACSLFRAVSPRR
jgi:hypothetical protein